jgi:hypothetical protein
VVLRHHRHPQRRELALDPDVRLQHWVNVVALHADVFGVLGRHDAAHTFAQLLHVHRVTYLPGEQERVNVSEDVGRRP